MSGGNGDTARARDGCREEERDREAAYGVKHQVSDPLRGVGRTDCRIMCLARPVPESAPRADRVYREPPLEAGALPEAPRCSVAPIERPRDVQPNAAVIAAQVADQDVRPEMPFASSHAIRCA